MKISYFLTTADSAGGTERAIITQANSMVEAGESVEILSLYRDSGAVFFDLDERVSVRYLVDRNTLTDLTQENKSLTNEDDRVLAKSPSRFTPASWDNQLSALTDQAAIRALSELNTDVLVTSTPSLTALSADFAPQGVVIVQQEHRPTGSRGATLEPVMLYGPRIDCLVSLTDRSTEWLAQKFGASAPRLETIPNSIPDVFRPQSVRQQPIIMAAGRFVSQKRFDHLIHAFARIAAHNPEWRLRIYGSGPHEKMYRDLAKKLGVDGRVELHPPVSDMLAEWSKASIAALSSRNEGLPLVALEAIAAGLPVVAYDCPTGPSEIIEDGVNGRLVPLADVHVLAHALEELVIDSEKRHRLGIAAKASAARFAPDVIQSKWAQLFNELLEEAAQVPERNRRVLARAQAAAETLLESSDHVTDGAEEEDASETSQNVSEIVLDLRDLKGHRISQRNFDLTTTALADAEIGFVPLRGYAINRSVVAISSKDKESLVSMLARSEVPGLRVQPLIGDRLVTPGYWEPSQTAEVPPAFGEANVLRVFREYVDKGSILRRGDGYACDIEIWEPLENGLLSAPRHNRIYDLLEPKTFSCPGVESKYEAAPDSGEQLPLWSDVTYPIDAVFTWVDGADRDWLRERAKYSTDSNTLHPESVSDARFANRDELKFALRGIEMYAPWIRKIFVVTAGQTPDWFVQADDRVQFISHDSLFPERDMLPTFNSHAIETVLHRIPGLSEHFMYFNDDTILARPQRPENYFTPNGLTKFFTSPIKINDLEGQVPPHINAATRNRSLIAQDFGVEISQCLLHTPHAHRKSVLTEMETKYAEEFRQTRFSRFRSDSDISLLSSFAQYYGYVTGQSVNAGISYAYVGLGRETTEMDMARALRNRSTDVITLGESNAVDEDPELTAFLVEQFLQSLVPIPSDYEESVV